MKPLLFVLASFGSTVHCCLQMPPELEKLQQALVSKDAAQREKAVRDLLNSELRKLYQEQIVEILLPHIRTPAQGLDNIRDQGLLIEHVGSYGPRAKAALLDLLALVANDKAPTYLRGQAVTACARIGPGDPNVIKTFIAALENPNPKNESGLHDRVIACLGDMGRAAWPAKAAVRSMLGHPWYQDGAFIALGKMARDEAPHPIEAYFGRLTSQWMPLERSAAAFLHITEAALHDKSLVPAAREHLWTVVEGRLNDVSSRAAMRALIELGPGASVQAAKLLVRNRFIPWSAEQGDMGTLAAQALLKFEAKDKEAVPVLIEGLKKGLHDRNRWTIARDFAVVLTRFGRDADAAAPLLLEGLRNVKGYEPNSYTRDLLEAYTDALGVLDGDLPGVRATVLELLAPDSKLMRESGKYAPVVEARLLTTLGRLKLPGDGPERETSLARVSAGLKSQRGEVLVAAAGVIRANPPAAPNEVKDVVPLLTRVLPFDFHLPGAKADRTEGANVHQIQFAALEALGALGPAAQDALPTLEIWAKRPLEPRRSDYLPEPAVNQSIRAAQKVLVQVRGT